MMPIVSSERTTSDYRPVLTSVSTKDSCSILLTEQLTTLNELIVCLLRVAGPDADKIARQEASLDFTGSMWVASITCTEAKSIP